MMGMNKAQIDDLNWLLEETRRIMTDKYVKGAKEYGTLLSEDYTVEELIWEGIQENVDGIVYGLEALRKYRIEKNGQS